VSEPEVRIDVAIGCAAWRRDLPRAAELARASARAALAQAIGPDAQAMPPVERIELGIVLTDDCEQRELNRSWRGIDRPTNVLAFPGWEPGAALADSAPLLLGDVVLAHETLAREAETQGKPLADHFRHLVIHGVLHLLGYDHVSDAEARLMETLETSILAGLGVADPYRGII
jgi:probable rRNA maturation factor